MIYNISDTMNNFLSRFHFFKLYFRKYEFCSCKNDQSDIHFNCLIISLCFFIRN